MISPPTDGSAALPVPFAIGGTILSRPGGILSVLQPKKWFKGCENLRSMIESESRVKYRKAMRLVQIYNNLVESGVSWNSIKALD